MRTRVVLCLAALLPFHALAQSVNTNPITPKILRGIVDLDNSNSTAITGTITISKGSKILQTFEKYSFTNNTFAIPLNADATKAITTGDTRIAVQIQEAGTSQNDDLTANLRQFDPDRSIVFVNPVTSIISAYCDLNPSVSPEDAAEQVGLVLGAGTLRQSPHTIDFDYPSFFAQSRVNGGFDHFIKQIAVEINTGAPLSIPRITESDTMERMPAPLASAAAPENRSRPAPSNPHLQLASLRMPVSTRAMSAAAMTPPALATPDFGGLFLNLAGTIFANAKGLDPVSSTAVGWVIETVFDLFDGSSTGKDHVLTQLEQIGDQQVEILEGIDQLSSQVSAIQTTITNQNNLNAYLTSARALRLSTSNLLDMEDQLVFVSMGGVGRSNDTFAQNLQARIQNEAARDLRNIYNEVEGDPVLHIPGLMDLWATAAGSGRGAPIFTDNASLRKAAPLAKYYLGIEVIGVNLQAELAHSLPPSIGNKIIIKTNEDFNSHHDIEMKLLANNRTIGNSELYAAVALPDNFDNLTIDTRSGLLWNRQGNTGLLQAFPSPAGVAAQPVASDYVNKFNTGFMQTLPKVNVAFDLPTRDQWKSLTEPSRATTRADLTQARTWLNSNGFTLNTDIYSWWTADLAQSTGTLQVFPAWDNWVIDLNNTFKGVIWYLVNNDPKDPIKFAHALLVSTAPLTPANQSAFFYKSGQDVIPLK